MLKPVGRNDPLPPGLSKKEKLILLAAVIAKVFFPGGADGAVPATDPCDCPPKRGNPGDMVEGKDGKMCGYYDANGDYVSTARPKLAG